VKRFLRLLQSERAHTTLNFLPDTGEIGEEMDVAYGIPLEQEWEEGH
jgi:hypothetical protein